MGVEVPGAAQALQLAGELLSKATAALAKDVEASGKVSIGGLDRRQLDAFLLAREAARLEAARAIEHYGARTEAAARGDGGLGRRMADAFVAETLRGLLDELSARSGEWGIDRADVEAARDRAWAFVAEALSAASWEALGLAVLENGGGAYGLDPERDLVRREFRRFADEVVAPVAERVHREDDLVPANVREGVAELGCFGLSIPERYGGLQPDDRPDHMGMVVVTEELSRASLGVAGSLITRPEILSKALLAGGTEAQRRRWLPALATGDAFCAVAVTEPDFGSDVAGVKVQAVRAGGGWKLSGQKTWCTFGGYADVLMVLARTDPDPSKGHRGLSILLAEKPRFEGHDFEHVQPGGGRVSGRAIDTIGYRGMHSFDVFFEDYLVPEDGLLGGEAGLGKGFYYQMEGFAGGRLQTAARATGVMQAALERAIAYAGERKVFGRPIAEYPLTRWKLARMATTVQTARQLTYHVARLLDEGGGHVEAALVKLWTSREAEWVTREAMQIHGGMGYAEEVDVSRFFVDARVFSIFEGAEEVLALRVVAKEVLQRALDLRSAAGGAGRGAS